MKTTPQALKKLYEALGGASADVENLSLTPDIIEAIAEVAPTGGGGGFMLVKYYTEDTEKGTQYYSETTAKEIIDAVKEGKNVVAELSLESGLTARLSFAGMAEAPNGLKQALFVSVGSQNVDSPLKLSSFVLAHRRMPGATEDIIRVGQGSGSLTE